MKAYRKVTGEYVELADSTPVSPTLTRVALRPSPNHTFTTTWATNPLDPAACWRLKTAGELDADKDVTVDAILAVAPALRAMVDVLYPYLTNPPTRLQLLTAIRARIKELV